MPADIGLLPDGWERSETSTGIPYYLNHEDETTQWEHPRTSELFIQLDDMNQIKFGAYRTAMKLRGVQKITHLNMVKCHILERSYKEFAIGPGSKHNDETYTVHELEALVSTAFQFVNQARTTDFIDVEQCVELTQNFVLKCLDSGRTGKMKVRTVKNILTAMAHSTLEEKYGLLFQHVCDQNNVGISQSNLKALLLDLLLLTNSVSESCTFPSETIDDATMSCWESANHFEPTHMLNNTVFLNWMFKEPICIVWLPTMYRITSSETVKHEAKCAVCSAFPIVGFRYRCLKCINVDLCQGCYWTQKTVKNHKITHPTREYCLATTTGDDVRDFAKQLKNKLTRRYRRKQPKVTYLKYPTTLRNPEADIPDECPALKNIHTRVNVLAERLQQLEDGGSGLADPVNTSAIRLHDVKLPANKTDSSQTPESHQSIKHRATHFSLEEVEELEGYITELQAANDAEVLARMNLERSFHETQDSVVVELEARVELEQQVYDLQESNQLLKDKVSQLLVSLPVTKPIRDSPFSVQSPPCSFIEMKTQRGNTASTSGFFEDRWNFTSCSQESTLLGGEGEEMKVILMELLALFPQRKKEVGAMDMNRAIFQAGTEIRDSLTELAYHIEN